MIPSAFNFLERIPLTSTGKTNRRALPEPDMSHLRREMVAPRNEQEQEMCNLWAQVLGLEEISVYDNFFRLGESQKWITDLKLLIVLLPVHCFTSLAHLSPHCLCLPIDAL